MQAGPPTIIGTSRAIRTAIADAKAVAPTTAAVLLRGESGTGKELFAALVHAESVRSRGPFVPVNCAALPDAIVESVLFGHRRGAFSGATDQAPGLVLSADRGTLFLDEVAELSLPVQAKLLRVLQQGAVLAVGETRERRVDVRVVCATHRDLRACVAAGTFREDLYFRLVRFEIGIPALRERGRDVVLIARHFLEHGGELGLRPRRLGRNTEADLLRHAWPGNVRELQNALFRAAVKAPRGYIGVHDLRAAIGAAAVRQPVGERILALLDQAGEVSSAAAMAATGSARTTFKEAMRALADDGEIVAVGWGRSRRYVRPSTLSPARDPRETAAVELAARDGRVTRQRLAIQLGIPLRTAGRVLARLVEAGLLVPDGRRGNGSGYVVAAGSSSGRPEVRQDEVGSGTGARPT